MACASGEAGHAATSTAPSRLCPSCAHGRPRQPYLFRLTLGTLGGAINRDGQDTQDDAAPSRPSCVSLFFPVAQLLGFSILESEQVRCVQRLSSPGWQPGFLPGRQPAPTQGGGLAGWPAADPPPHPGCRPNAGGVDDTQLAPYNRGTADRSEQRGKGLGRTVWSDAHPRATARARGGYQPGGRRAPGRAGRWAGAWRAHRRFPHRHRPSLHGAHRSRAGYRPAGVWRRAAELALLGRGGGARLLPAGGHGLDPRLPRRRADHLRPHPCRRRLHRRGRGAGSARAGLLHPRPECRGRRHLAGRYLRDVRAGPRARGQPLWPQDRTGAPHLDAPGRGPLLRARPGDQHRRHPGAAHDPVPLQLGLSPAR